MGGDGEELRGLSLTASTGSTQNHYDLENLRSSLDLSFSIYKMGECRAVLAHAFNLSAWEAEAIGSL